jgi:hypothetical protein
MVRRNCGLIFPFRIVAVAAVLTLAAVAARAGEATATVLASQLNNPRGLKFGPDGYLYVAEGGLGGSATTSIDQCVQVPPPVGPYSGGFTARISKISPAGLRTTVVDNLPSSQTSEALGSLMSGVGDVAFIGNDLYALMAGAGCSHGLLDTTNAVLRVNSDGTTTQIADLSAFQNDHPVLHREDDDFEPDGTWYSMVAIRGDLYAVEPNHGEVDRIDPQTGTITRVVDVSATQGHIVPTAIAYRGNFFFGNLGTFPVEPGSAKILKLNLSGRLEPWVTGLTTVLGLAFDAEGRLYVLESMTAAGAPGPNQFGTGRVVRVGRSGELETIYSGLSFPTAMTFGPDGSLYVSNLGFAGPGAGEIVRVTIPN